MAVLLVRFVRALLMDVLPYPWIGAARLQFSAVRPHYARLKLTVVVSKLPLLFLRAFEHVWLISARRRRTWATTL